MVRTPGSAASKWSCNNTRAYTNDIEITNAAGLSLRGGEISDIGVSGHLGWESGAFTTIDQSGTTDDRGKYTSVFARKDGKWLIIRDN